MPPRPHSPAAPPVPARPTLPPPPRHSRLLWLPTLPRRVLKLPPPPGSHRPPTIAITTAGWPLARVAASWSPAVGRRYRSRQLSAAPPPLLRLPSAHSRLPLAVAAAAAAAGWPRCCDQLAVAPSPVILAPPAVRCLSAAFGAAASWLPPLLCSPDVHPPPGRPLHPCRRCCRRSAATPEPLLSLRQTDRRPTVAAAATDWPPPRRCRCSRLCLMAADIHPPAASRRPAGGRRRSRGRRRLQLAAAAPATTDLGLAVTAHRRSPRG